MKILLFGGAGQLGRQLRRSLAVLGEVVAPARGTAAPCGDLLDLQGVAATVATSRAEVVVNAAAWTDVDGAERDPTGAQAVNAAAVDAIARACADAGSWFVHFSTDYVFDGAGNRPWREDDAPHPLSAYGRSKLAGEQAAGGALPRHLVLRTSWLFEPGHHNFVTSILRAAATRETLDVVDDQWGAPTRAALVADVLAHMLVRWRVHPRPEQLAGTYHVSASGSCSRHECARLIVDAARANGMALRLQPGGLHPASMAPAAGAARRPLNCRLDTTKLAQAFDLRLPPWQDGVLDAIATVAGIARQAAQ